MGSRRTEQRFVIRSSPEGTFRTYHNVALRVNRGEWSVVSRVPVAVGETVTLRFMNGRTTDNVEAVVTEDRLVVIEGVLQHQLRLRRNAAATPAVRRVRGSRVERR